MMLAKKEAELALLKNFCSDSRIRNLVIKGEGVEIFEE